MDRTKNVSRTEMTNSQQKTFHQPETKKEKPNPHTGLNIGTWTVRTLRTAGNWDVLLDEARMCVVSFLEILTQEPCAAIRLLRTSEGGKESCVVM